MIETSTDANPIRIRQLSSPWSQATDEDLMVEYGAKKRPEVFAELVHRYHGELYGYLRRYLGDANAAEDVFQQTFLQVHLKCDRFDASRKFRPWLYTIATHQAIDGQRRTRRHRLVSLDSSNQADGQDVGSLLDLLARSEAMPSDRLVAEEQREWVRRALDDLPESLRSAIHLVYFQGLKYRQAAEILSVPVGTVKSRLHSAIFRLNQAWTAGNSAGVD